MGKKQLRIIGKLLEKFTQFYRQITMKEIKVHLIKSDF